MTPCAWCRWNCTKECYLDTVEYEEYVQEAMEESP